VVSKKKITREEKKEKFFNFSKMLWHLRISLQRLNRFHNRHKTNLPWKQLSRKITLDVKYYSGYRQQSNLMQREVFHVPDKNLPYPVQNKNFCEQIKSFFTF
jgi:hypothetical protein